MLPNIMAEFMHAWACMASSTPRPCPAASAYARWAAGSAAGAVLGASADVTELQQPYTPETTVNTQV